MSSVFTRTSRLKRARRLSGVHQQIIRRDDFATDKVRQAAVGKGSVRAALEDRDFTSLTNPPRQRCRAGPTGDAAYDNFII